MMNMEYIFEREPKKQKQKQKEPAFRSEKLL